MSKKNAKKILLAVSGGVDSAVCAKLLRDDGYEVRGLYLIMSDAHFAAADDAKSVGSRLGFDVDVIDARKLFAEKVSGYFCKSYCEGKTPNPCVVCNPQVKFELLKSHADELGFLYLATGHYAQIVCQDGIFKIKKAFSEQRDQSYMLYRLGQDVLSRLILPLAMRQKDDVRLIAKESLPLIAEKPDSQEICFIPDGDFPRYINEHGFHGKQGRFISPNGAIYGSHLGTEHYTVGQRKGLNVSLGSPVYVKAILDNGDIQLVFADDNLQSEYTIENIVCFKNGGFVSGNRFTVKLRSMAKSAFCTITQVSRDSVSFVLDTPQLVAARGQSAVFYDIADNTVAGGGFIR